MRGQKYGLRVAYHDHVEHIQQHTSKVLKVAPSGWYIETFRGTKWVAIMDLSFRREKDALRGAMSLTAAGLDCASRLAKADRDTVRELACRFLQW